MAQNPNYQTGQKPTSTPLQAAWAATANSPQAQQLKAAMQKPTTAQPPAGTNVDEPVVTATKPKPSVQTQQTAKTTQEALGGVYQVQPNGQAPKGLKVGDQVVTGGGTYTIKGVNADGTYTSQLTNKAQTTGNYKGTYTTAPTQGRTYQVQPNGQAPKGLKVGDQVVTGGGTYQITGFNADGSYQSKLVNQGQTTANYKGAYANAASPAAQKKSVPQQPQHAQSYVSGVDYEAEINKAVAAGDLGAAAVLEQMRNAKIHAEGLSNKYATTNTYAQYLGGVSPERQAQLRNGYAVDTQIKTQNPYPGMEDLTKQLYDAAGQQIQADIDYNVEQGVNELNRALEDAQPMFQQQRNQVDIDEAKAKSNSALYAEARGDRGGIGQSQYNEIQAAAMQNRQAINTAQTKLATDTARQIADLRAQGKHDAATALLQNTQKYLAQLMSLKQAGAEWALNVEQMQNTIDQQLRNHALQVANITGVYDGKPTYAAQKYEQGNAQSLLEALLKYGVMPSKELLNAAGYSGFSGDLSKLTSAVAAANFSSGGSGGGGSSGSRSGGGGSGKGSGTPTGTPSTFVDNTTTAEKAAAAARLTGNVSKNGKAADMTNAVSNGGYLEDYKTLASAEKYWSQLEREANGGMSKKYQRLLLQGWLDSKKIDQRTYNEMVAAYGLDS